MLQNLLVLSETTTKVSRTSLNESMITYVKLAQRKLIMNDLITIMKFSIRCTVFRVINHNFSIVTNEKEIRKSIQMQFRTQVGYVIINNLKPAFWKNIYKPWCSHLTEVSKETYDLSNHIKVPTKKRKDKHAGNIKMFHGRFNVFSDLISPFKLKIFNCSHRHSSESTVHQGSLLEVIIPDNCLWWNIILVHI